MQYQTFEISYTEYNDGITSVGRNGSAKTKGLFVQFSPDFGVSVYPVAVDRLTLSPVTSKGDIQNCNIDIPLVDFWRLVTEMEQAGLRNP